MFPVTNVSETTLNQIAYHKYWPVLEAPTNIGMRGSHARLKYCATNHANRVSTCLIGCRVGRELLKVRKQMTNKEKSRKTILPISV